MFDLNVSFIRLCDYLIVDTFHVLAVNSVQSLKNYFLEQIEATPNKDEIVGYVEEIKRKVDKATAAEGEDPTAQPPPTEQKPPPQPPPQPQHIPGLRQPGEVKQTSTYLRFLIHCCRKMKLRKNTFRYLLQK